MNQNHTLGHIGWTPDYKSAPIKAKTTLHPPETAPKDGKMILGDFGYPWLIPAAWNDHDENWVTAVMAAQEMREGTTDIWFDNEREKPESLAGWLPMPEKPRKTK